MKFDKYWAITVIRKIKEAIERKNRYGGILMEKQIGYARISTQNQNEDRQIIALMEMGVPEENIYVDKQSGKNFERKQYKKMLRKMKPGVVLYIKSIDRLGRNYQELNEQWRIITKDKGADIVVIDMPILDTRREKNLLGTFISDLILTLLSYVSENELCSIKQRQKEGIEAAKRRGVQFGRPKKPEPENFEQIYNRWILKEINGEEAARLSNLTMATFYRHAKRWKENQKKE